MLVILNDDGIATAQAVQKRAPVHAAISSSMLVHTRTEYRLPFAVYLLMLDNFELIEKLGGLSFWMLRPTVQFVLLPCSCCLL